VSAAAGRPAGRVTGVDALLAPSPHPHGLPDFPAFDDADFRPAFDRAIAAHRAEIEQIAGDRVAPTFVNTVEALERSGRELARVSGVFFNLIGSDANAIRKQVATEVASLLTEHENMIALHPDLFARVEAVYSARDDLALDEPARRLLEKRYRSSVRRGARLDADGQTQMREISARLAVLTTEFSQLVLDDSNAAALLVDDAEELEGLGDSSIAAAAAAAEAAGHSAGYLLPLDLPTSQSALASLQRKDIRQRLLDAAATRGARSNEFDTRAHVLEIARLRARRAELLGYRDHAHYVIEEETAPSVDSVAELLGRLTAAASAAGGRELTRLTALSGNPMDAADVTYWLAQEQKSGSETNLDDFADYCELDTVLTKGVFYAAARLYRLRFTERHDLPTYHPDVRVWEVFDEHGSAIGLYLGDYFARPSKRGGAWMNNFVDQSTLLGDTPVIVNVLNVTKPVGDAPCLLSVDELTTLFHEFGHALHGLLSKVRYSSQSGTSVPRDFVEFPSQVNEMWALHPDVLANYAVHHRTGEPIPAELAAAARAAGKEVSAHSTLEYLAAAVLDLAWHRLTADEADAVNDVEAFEAEALRDAGLGLELIPPRYRSTYFNHIFGGGYSAGYYSYIWSEVLDADTEQWFLDGGGLTRAGGQRFADAVLSRGDSTDPIAAHREMLGREPRIEPLLRRRGLLPA